MHLFLSCVPVSTLVDILISNAKEIIQKSETFRYQLIVATRGCFTDQQRCRLVLENTVVLR
jgi:hypothetical protein